MSPSHHFRIFTYGRHELGINRNDVPQLYCSVLSDKGSLLSLLKEVDISIKKLITITELEKDEVSGKIPAILIFSPVL